MAATAGAPLHAQRRRRDFSDELLQGRGLLLQHLVLLLGALLLQLRRLQGHGKPPVLLTELCDQQLVPGELGLRRGRESFKAQRALRGLPARQRNAAPAPPAPTCVSLR